MRDFMTRECYQCGHVKSKIFIKKNIAVYNLYLMWKEKPEPKVCFHCFANEGKKTRKLLKIK